METQNITAVPEAIYSPAPIAAEQFVEGIRRLSEGIITKQKIYDYLVAYEIRAEDLERCLTLFPRLRERLTQKGGSLSGGEQQMLAIGRALMSRPRLLLLDEPSLGLSPILVQQIFELIREINRQGTTVLLVEQNALQALAVAARGYVLQTGKVILADTAAALTANQDVRRAYLGEI